jgi:hypothetical protein
VSCCPACYPPGSLVVPPIDPVRATGVSTLLVHIFVKHEKKAYPVRYTRLTRQPLFVYGSTRRVIRGLPIFSFYFLITYFLCTSHYTNNLTIRLINNIVRSLKFLSQSPSGLTRCQGPSKIIFGAPNTGYRLEAGAAFTI